MPVQNHMDWQDGPDPEKFQALTLLVKCFDRLAQIVKKRQISHGQAADHLFFDQHLPLGWAAVPSLAHIWLR